MLRVTAVRFSSLGDVVLTLPALAAVRAHHPHVHITYATREPFARLLRISPLIDQVWTLERTGGVPALAQRARLAGTHAVLDFHDNLRSHFMTLEMGRIPTFRTPGKRLARWRILACRGQDMHRAPDVEPVWRRHCRTVARLLHSRVGSPPRASSPTIPTPGAWDPSQERARASLPLLCADAGASWADQHLPRGATRVALLPGARYANKRWPALAYRALAGRLESSGVVPVLFGSADEVPLLQFVAEGARHAVLVPSDWPIMVAALHRCRTAVGNDSGLTHLAEAVGTPVVALFGPTTPAFGFGPRLALSTVIQQHTRCRPCTRHGGNSCRTGDHRCLATITPDEVAAVVLETISKHEALKDMPHPGLRPNGFGRSCLYLRIP